MSPFELSSVRRAPASRKNTWMAEWWDGKPDERYWCEITKREDIGANLRCPQLNTSGDPYWSYSLIHHVRPGDIVFHYSKKAQGVIGASVAGGPIEERDIIWSAQGTSGRAKRHQSPRKRSGQQHRRARRVASAGQRILP